ncbi:enoyl-CoA hydratase/isomerase family protein [Oceanobacillus halotolerans]|uniref:enoyl-CoA hydratase/isomerase family protein n=1 Tax=Oceanobacillus halotolerans TaxID=2663380 RepID=UPI0013DAD3F6|nr:enoyl-CoA hydratase/isomerase family protein [Oceanobacillus halotolerans]
MILVEKKKDYAIIRLNRPAKRNAISLGMAKQLKEAIEQVKEMDIKCLVITGSGDQTFCAGGDLNHLHGNLTSDEAFRNLYDMKEVLYGIASFPVPTICLLNGDAYGGGCELATACDFRLAKENTTFGFVQSKLGIMPGWGGGVLLYEKLHPSIAYQWLVEAGMYSASYLQQQGWIHRIIPSDEIDDLEKLLKPYIQKSLKQMYLFKKQYKKKLSMIGLSAQMDEEVRDCATLWDTTEHKQAVERFLSRK